jgi:hypothetical protein
MLASPLTLERTNGNFKESAILLLEKVAVFMELQKMKGCPCTSRLTRFSLLFHSGMFTDEFSRSAARKSLKFFYEMGLVADKKEVTPVNNIFRFTRECWCSGISNGMGFGALDWGLVYQNSTSYGLNGFLCF